MCLTDNNPLSRSFFSSLFLALFWWQKKLSTKIHCLSCIVLKASFFYISFFFVYTSSVLGMMKLWRVTSNKVISADSRGGIVEKVTYFCSIFIHKTFSLWHYRDKSFVLIDKIKDVAVNFLTLLNKECLLVFFVKFILKFNWNVR